MMKTTMGHKQFKKSAEWWQANTTKSKDQQYSADTKHHKNPRALQRKKKRTRKVVAFQEIMVN